MRGGRAVKGENIADVFWGTAAQRWGSQEARRPVPLTVRTGRSPFRRLLRADGAFRLCGCRREARSAGGGTLYLVVQVVTIPSSSVILVRYRLAS